MFRWEAFKQLRQKVEDFQTILPLLQELSKESIKKRHWEEIVHLCGGACGPGHGWLPSRPQCVQDLTRLRGRSVVGKTVVAEAFVRAWGV